MVKVIPIVLIGLMVPGAFGASWTVCVEDSESLLTVPMQGAITREFRAVMGKRGTGLAFGSCATAGTRIHLAVEDEPPMGLEGVLGLAHRKGGRIEPQLKIFYGPLVRYLGRPNNTEAIGRAMARVAAHEAEHFLKQQGYHCEQGLLQPMVSAYELLAPGPWPYQRGPHCAPSETAQHGPELLANAPRAK